MKVDRATPTSIDEYITAAPPEARSILGKIRETIKMAAPAAEEKISYQMPTFTLKGNLVHFAAFTSVSTLRSETESSGLRRRSTQEKRAI